MHNNEFEKRVGHKLEELKFTPSDAVWQKVEVHIREKKRRRKFFFWWLPAIVLCTGVAGWFIYSLETGNEQTKNSAVITEKKAEPTSTVTNNSGEPGGQESKSEVEAKKVWPVIEIVKQQEQTPAVTTKEKITAPLLNEHVSVNSKRESIKKPTIQIVTKEESPIVSEVTTPTVGKTETVAVNNPAAVISNPVVEKNRDTAIAKKQEEQISEMKPVAYDSSVNSKTQTAPVAEKPVVSKKKKIEFAAVLRVGISDMSRFSERLKMGNVVYASPGTSSGSGNPFPIPVNSSKIKAGAGFAAGIQLKRPMTKRSALSTGLAYAYYSSSYKTGATVYSAAQFNNDVRNTLVNSYAMVGNSAVYAVRYHFVEIPLMYHLRLNKVGKRSVFFNGGVAYSYLLGSNAQYYYKATGAYYYDRILFNRSQLQLRTGVSMDLIKKLNYPLQIGAQYQFSLSGQWKKSLDLNQHLSFTGIQLSWRLNKK